MVVAHNGTQYLPETLTALAGQTRPADFCIGVDAGSTDASASLLQLGLPAGSPVIAVPSKSGFGAAVKAGLAELPAAAGDSGTVDWLWLLHDDSAPAPTALQELLLAVERAPSVTIAGAKQVDWDNERRLVDVGVSISRWAERVTLIDADELDQGQYDSRSDIFAVNSAGMLVRRDIWEALGGFDPALPGTGDDVDLCWRNRLAGHRVVVVPAARIRHAGNRPNTAASAAASRQAEIFLRLKHAPLWQVPFLALGAVLGGFGRLVLGLLAKDPGYAVGSLLASVRGVLRPMDLYRSRRAAKATRVRPRSAVHSLRTGRREVSEHRRSLFESGPAAADGPVTLPSGTEGPAGAGRDPGAHEPSGDSNDDFSSLAAPARAWVGVGAVAAVLLLLAASLSGLHRFIGASALSGGALLPVSGSLGVIWANASAWWIELGAGYPGHADPFGYVLWLLGAAGLGNANAAVVTTVLIAMPLAGLSAWFASGALTARRGLRFWAAVFWGTAPALQVALGEGRLGALLAHLLLPLVVLGMFRAVGSGRPDPTGVPGSAPGSVPGTGGNPSWTAAAASGLVLAVVTASAPLLFVIAALAVLLVSLRLRSRARTLWWSLVPSAALLLPIVLSTLDRPRALAADPGVPLAFDPAPLWQQLLGFPSAFGTADSLPGWEFLPAGPWMLVLAVLIGAPVLLLSVCSLFTGHRTALSRLAWVLSLAALALSWLSGLVATGASATALVTPFTGPLVSVAVFLQLCAALLAADRFLAAGSRSTKAAKAETSGAAAAEGKPVAGAPAMALAQAALRASAAEKRTPRRSSAPLRAVALGVLLAVGPAAGLAAWILPQATAPTDAASVATPGGTQTVIQPAAARTLPATAADKGVSPDRTRTLVLRTDANDDVTAALMRDAGSTLDAMSSVYAASGIRGPAGSEELAADDSADADIRRAVAVITVGTGVDPRGELSRLGVGYVVLQQSDTSAELLASRMDSVPGLAAVGQTGSGWLWRVVGQTDEQGTESLSGQTGRVRVLAADGSVESVVPSGRTAVYTDLPAGGDGRILVLSERADAGWRASLDGVPLTGTTHGWAQAFELPAEGGRLSVDYDAVWEPWLGAFQVLAIALTVLLAVPTRARNRTVRLPGKQAPVRPGPDAVAGSEATAGTMGQPGSADRPSVPAESVSAGPQEPAGRDLNSSHRDSPEQVSAAGDTGTREGMR